MAFYSSDRMKECVTEGRTIAATSTEGFELPALCLVFDIFANSPSPTHSTSVMSVFGGVVSTIHELDVDSSSLSLALRPSIPHR